ncbi:MAG: penicillin-binding protein 2, partial [Planctomycetota bacterium]
NAAHLIGAVGRDEVGLEGVERTRNRELTGEPGMLRTRVDKRRRAIASPDTDFRPPTHGKHLVLTVDSQIQLIVEEELARQRDALDAESVTAVVLDPRTGDVLAMAVYPSYYPQYLSDSTDDLRRNRVLVDPYEPGSGVKPFIMAKYLEQGLTTPDEVVTLGGKSYRTPYGRRITDFFGYDELSVWDVIVKSSNIGMVKLGERTDGRAVKEHLEAFGFGQSSGLELPGESGGQLPTRFTEYTRDSLSFGYEMLSTPMQMARAMTAIANGGLLATPRLVAGYVDASGQFAADVQPQVKPQVVRKDVADLMLRILADVSTERGSGKHGRSERWNLFGKTGTAHRVVDGGYNETDYIASFVGGGPYEDPRLVIAVSVVGPNKEVAHTGGKAAAPMAGRILERSLEHLLVPESPELPPPPREMWDKLRGWTPPKQD